MKLELTKKEYGLMLDIFAVANWIMNGYAMSDDEHDEHDTLRNKIFSYFKTMDAEDKIALAADSDDYVELTDYEDHVHEQFIQPYEENFFWDELIDRLAKRDLLNALGKDALSKMNPDELVRQYEKAKEPYENEFEKHGLDRLDLKSKSSDVKKSK